MIGKVEEEIMNRKVEEEAQTTNKAETIRTSRTSRIGNLVNYMKITNP